MSERFSKVLVANRGEIAIRIFRACTELGLRTVALYSWEDRRSLHRYKADQSFLTRDSDPVRSYLDVDSVLDVARASGAEAIHPGYGFLSEQADFARACTASGVVFVGPAPSVLETMGDKVRARDAAVRSGLAVIPGSGALSDVDAARAFARDAGYPVVYKAAHGGGGRGMRVARSEAELVRYFDEASNESLKAFGKADVFLEKYLERPKHIEVQILGDSSGNVVHLLERDCSVQRRHQKIVEFAPSASLSSEVRQRLYDWSVKLGRDIGYTNAGTVEFLVAASGEPYFIEMNPRLQVEHTVTEEVTGIDLVKAQIRIAQGETLDQIGIRQEGVHASGFAVQCRMTTEDPANNFTPSAGKLTVFRTAAGFGVRLDQGNAFTGAVIGSHYDSLLVKLICSGATLRDACATALRALVEFRIRGVQTNIPFLENVVSHPVFLSGAATTDFVESTPELFQFAPRRDRATRLLRFLAEVTVNGSAMVPVDHPARQATWPVALPPAIKRGSEPGRGTRQILDELGPDAFVNWIADQKRLLITDTTFRDAHQSLLATRVRTYDLLRVAPAVSRHAPQLFSLEMWGGATFDAQLRFLRENPWNRLTRLRGAVPNICFQMLLRGSNAVGYTSYPDNVVREFVMQAAHDGIDIFRIFDSLNWPEQMQVAIDAVRDAGKVAEAAICYSGDLADPREDKFTRDYYIALARELKSRGAHLLAIKDMAGLLRPLSAAMLVKILKDETGMAVHLHTHDTAGVQAATYLRAADAGVDIVDCAFGPMSGLTSQPNLESVVAMFDNTERDTGLDLRELHDISDYWENVRPLYAPFESGLLAGSAQVYEHEMPGGQYANLRVQARSLGLEDRWPEIKRVYAEVNQLFGNIVKVTPSSKVVGDLSLYLVTNGLTVEDLRRKGNTVSFPQSVVDLVSGKLGQPYGQDGWPEDLVRMVLKGKKPDVRRPGSLLEPVDPASVLDNMAPAPDREAKSSDALSAVLYPKVFEEYLEHRAEFGDVAPIPSAAFFYGLREDEEITVTLEPGKNILVKLLTISDPNESGMRTVFFELNGTPRSVEVFDKGSGKVRQENERADPANKAHIPAPLPGTVVAVRVKEGDAVAREQPLCTLEAMKMETTVLAPVAGTVERIVLSQGDKSLSGDLLMVVRP
jgi:pyruvate carboxylase